MRSPIEDPIEAARQQFPPDSPNLVLQTALAVIENLPGPFGSAIKSQLERFTSNQSERLSYFVEVAMKEIQSLQDQLDHIQGRLSEPEAAETLLVALERVARTQNRERIQRFARVFGAGLRSDTLSWDETRAFLYDVERLTDQDIEALGSLDIEGGRRANSKEDVEFQSRCGRLIGFGLAVAEVEPLIGGANRLYTASPRGKWLISVAGDTVTSDRHEAPPE